jgi:hypothetical protein
MELRFMDGRLMLILDSETWLPFEEEWLADLAALRPSSLPAYLQYVAVRILPGLDHEQQCLWIERCLLGLPPAVQTFAETFREVNALGFVPTPGPPVRTTRGHGKQSEARHVFNLEGLCAECGGSQEATEHFGWVECVGLVSKCVAIHGMKCVTCGFDSEAAYGGAGQGMVHLHSLRSWEQAESSPSLDPAIDLRPICANCHAVIHSTSPAYTLRDMRRLVHERDRGAA